MFAIIFKMFAINMFANTELRAPLCFYTSIFIVYVSGDFTMHVYQIASY